MTESLVDVALLAYGGPETAEQVVPFLERLMGRTPDPGTVAAVQERYALIGGASPLPAITARQAAALELKLGERLGGPVRVRHGFLYTEPGVADLRPFSGRAPGGRAAHEPVLLPAHERQVQGADRRRRGPRHRRRRPRDPAARGLVLQPGVRPRAQPPHRRGVRLL